jgi:hypothetical protein
MHYEKVECMLELIITYEINDEARYSEILFHLVDMNDNIMTNMSCSVD